MPFTFVVYLYLSKPSNFIEMKPFLIIAFLLLNIVVTAQMLSIHDHELIETSEDIVRGTVISSKAQWVNNGQLIYTFTRVRVNETLSGKIKKGEIITIVAPGGYDPEKDLGMKVSHQALFEDGEDVVVFLVKAEGEMDAIDYRFLQNEPALPKKIMRVNGYFQGKRKIFKDPVTNRMMIHKPNEDRTVEFNAHQLELKQELKHLHLK